LRVVLPPVSISGRAQADLLKVAHHGSATSTIPELLAAVHLALR
jgi:beta-lactamase superfamily II metal-dependent hydrolase